MKIIILCLSFCFIFNVCWSDSINTINDYYGISEKTVVVWPSADLTNKETEPDGILKFVESVSQWGEVQTVRDDQFNPEEYTQQVIFILGTEKTNSFLQKNITQLLPHTSDNQIQFLDKTWPTNGTSLICLNRFDEKTMLVFYTASIENANRLFDVFHGNTSFLVFNSLCTTSSPEDYLARGDLKKINDKWTVTNYSTGQIIPKQYVISAVNGNSPLLPGDIILKYANQEIYNYNLNYLFSSLEDIDTSLVFSRNGKIMQLKIKPKILFGKNHSFSMISSTIPLLNAQNIKERLNNYLNLLERAWIDTWDLMDSPEWNTIKKETLNQNEETHDIIYAWLELNKLLSRLNDGHAYTNLDEIKSYLRRKILDSGNVLFPFQPLISGAKMYIPENSLKLPKGAQILAINQQPGEKLIKNLASLCSGDCLDHKISSFDNKDFALWLYILNGGNYKYKLLLYNDNRQFSVTIDGCSYFQTENSLNFPESEVCEISPDTLLFTLNSFSESFEPLITEAINKLHSGNYKSFILDLRNNSGGSTTVADILLNELILEPYYYYKAERNKRSREAENYGMDFNSATAYGQREFQRINYKNKPSKNAFKGDIYVITSAETFSTAFDVSLSLKLYRGATLVGEAPGGLFIQSGNHFMTEVFYGLTASVPYRDYLSNQDYFADYESATHSARLTPDYEVFYTQSSIQQNIDPHIKLIMELIKQK